LSLTAAAARGREPFAPSSSSPAAIQPAAVPAASDQPASADSLKMPRRTAAAMDTAARVNVIQLEDIRIQGEVEKPSVIILPKRIEPDMQADSLDRSFSQEIRRNTGEVPTPDRAINRVEPVKSIKKEIEKKRK
jgi:hypothetical protein